MRAEPEEPRASRLAAAAAGGAADAGGVPVGLLGDFLDVVWRAVEQGAPIRPTQLRRYRSLGDRAARQGVALRALLDLYLSAAWRVWRELPPVAEARDAGRVVVAGEVMLHAVDDVVAALAEGYQLARRALVRAQESERREFIDDLLGGASDVVGVVHRAGGFGLDLAGPHCVAVISAERAFTDGMPIIAALERSILGIKGDAQALLASKEGRLVVVFAAPDRAAITHVITQLGATLDSVRTGRAALGPWQLGIGRPGVGAGGVLRAYQEATDALELATRLALAEQVVDARDLLVYRVLLQDRATLRDLVESTLGPLRAARGGARPLLDTLSAYFAAGGNTAACARELHLSVRAVTYRLGRVTELTDLSPDAADSRFALHVAVLGARLLDWPAT